MPPFEIFQKKYNAISQKMQGKKINYNPQENIWAHFLKGIMIGHERRLCTPRKMHADFCEEINKPIANKIYGHHPMIHPKHGNMKCWPYYERFSKCRKHAATHIELRCRDQWVNFEQALLKQNQKKAAERGTPQEWYEAGIDMFLRIPKTRAEKMGPEFAPDMILPTYVPKKKEGESLGDTLGEEVNKRYRLLSVCMLRKDRHEHLRREQISQLDKPPISNFEAQEEMVEGNGGKEKMAKVLVQLKLEKEEARKKDEHWGKRKYESWKDVTDYPQGYTSEIFERRRIFDQGRRSEWDP